ncbi:MAG: monovalent cation/H+ antiporter subunit D [Betaproteobacteria bacterium]
MSGWPAHLIITPILLPLLSAIVMLLLGERRRWKGAVSVASSMLGLLVAIALLGMVNSSRVPAVIGVYLPSNWDVPFGIVLAVDRLSALMLVLSAIIGLCSVLFSLARWDRGGVHFHPLLQIQLMGLNGAFLTGDLFNLFVFFEVLLAASYGLLLHGSGRARVLSGMHYIAVNLLASSLFLIGAALIYGVAGTLNMADLAQKIPQVAQADRGLLHAGAAILAIAFLTKAAMWPLNFWLVPAYTAASAPVAALFAIMTKVGVYTVLRLWTLLFSAHAGASALFGADVLIYGGLATLAFGTAGLLASQKLGRLASFSTIVSAGTLLAAIGFGQAALTAAALFYLLTSTLAISAMFLLVELIERSRQAPSMLLVDEADEMPFPPEPLHPARDVNLDDQQRVVIGTAIPAALVFLGVSFIACALLIAGLPPFSGFLAKFSMLSALLNPFGLGHTGVAAAITGRGWMLLALIIASGLLSMIALSRAGIRYFWSPQNRLEPRLSIVECLPIVALLVACALLTIRADPVMRYAQATADALQQPSHYIDAVMSARPVPNPPGLTAIGAGAVK